MRKRRKVLKPKKGTKLVRVDHKTLIEVSVDRSDEDAIKEFLEKIELNKPSYRMKRKDEKEKS